MNHTKETMTRQVGLGKTLRTSLYEIERKATKNKKHKFENLYQLLNSQNLIEAYREINKQASSGIDGQSAKEFGENLIEEVTKIEEELKTNRYRTSLVKRTYIVKPGGGQRPLGIPTVKDKTIQIATKKILEAIYEPEFIESSMGYRKNRGAKQAVEYLGKELNFGKYTYIVEADIKGFFDNVNHQWLKRMLEEKVRDKRIITLIEKWLKASIKEPTGEIEKPQKGTPQGGAISPILANIYLHYTLDLWFEKIVEPKSEGECKLVRYADDFVCAFRYKRDAERFMKTLGKRLGKFGLTLAEEKTKMIKFSRFEKDKNDTFDFLGFTFRWEKSRKGKDIITHKTSKKGFKRTIQKFKEWIRENRHCRLMKMFKELNTKLRGYYNYYGIIGNSKKITQVYRIVIEMLYKWLNRRSQRKSFIWKEFWKVIKRYKLLKPYITSKYQQMTMKISC